MHPIGERRDIVVTFKNVGVELPLNFSISKITHFRCNPSASSLLPGQSVKVTFTFYPSQIGFFSNSLHIVVDDGVAIIPFKVMGSAISAFIKDTNPYLVRTQNKNPQFIESDENFKLSKPTSKKLAKNESLSKAQLFFQNTNDCDELKHTWTTKEIEKRMSHKTSYNQYVKRQYESRQSAS